MTDLIPDEDGFTELVDPNVPRVDLVGRPANGAPGWLLMKQDEQAGLLDADYIRDLIGKSAPEPDTQKETVTMTGSPGAIAKLIHEAAQRRDGAEVAKAEKSTKAINDLPDGDFAYIEPGGKKDAEGKTVPRDLRHFPIMDAAHVRNALSRAPQSPFGDKAMPKIRAAAKKFGIDVAKALDDDGSDDTMDPTVILAEPDDDDAPGDPTDPGSPAWEAIDAATARKWTAILARARAALAVMSDREMLEAATADPDDADNAMDLDGAADAIDYAISIVAPFAVDEQSEADTGTDDMMAAVGKALAGFDTSPLDTFEALAYVAKAGRSLSAANEQAIRDAVASLQKVLASLPAAPVEKESGPTVAKTANEEPNMPEPTVSEDVTRESGQQPAMGTAEPAPKPEAGVPVTDMAKADSGKTPMVAVYDSKGKLVGICDPTEITPISGADTDDDSDDSGDASSDDTPDDTDLTPAPAAEVGTAADATPPDNSSDGDDDAAVTKTTRDKNDTDLSEMLKSSLLDLVKSAIAEQSATQTAQIATTGDAVLELANMVETLKGQVQTLEEQPAEPKVFTQGAGPRPQHLRGQDRGAPPVDVTKAREMKQTLYRGTAAEQNQAAHDMQSAAIEALQAIHGRG